MYKYVHCVHDTLYNLLNNLAMLHQQLHYDLAAINGELGKSVKGVFRWNVPTNRQKYLLPLKVRDVGGHFSSRSY